jgi:tetratricopeptide (TPR) repeat protein
MTGKLNRRWAPLAALFLVLALAACRAPAAESTPPPLDLPTADTATPSPLPPTATATPTFAELLTQAQDAANSGDWGGAIALLNQALIMNNASAQAYFLLGNTYKSSGDFSQAISNYDQAVAVDPNFSAAYQNRGLTYQQMGNTDQALANISKAIELSPTFALAYRNRAEIQRGLGNATAASYDLQVYLGLVPNAPDRAQVEAVIAELQAQAVQNAGEEGLLFFDDFSSAECGWFTNGDPASPGLCADGGYVLVEKQTNASVWALPGRLFSDVRIEVTATKQAGDEDSNFFGVICRVQGTSGSAGSYAFLITSDGYYGIAKIATDGSQTSLSLIKPDAMLFSSVINQGDSTNKITAVCSGTRLALYVNDQLLIEANDADYTTGQVGILAGAFSKAAGTSIFFDDFKVFTEAPQ